jgi:hypothetical protein
MLVDVPSSGIRGTTHVPVSDSNNVVMADLPSEFLRQKGLD